MSPTIRAGAAAVLAAAMLLPGICLFAVDRGGAAPRFEMPRLDGAGYVRSNEIFSRYDETFLVFWRSSCPHCVQALLGCERFYREYGGTDITVIGINGDERDVLAAQGVIESNGITFTQAIDAGGTTSASYGVPHETFAVYLVGEGGLVLGVRIDPQGDLGKAMEEMLLSSAGSAARSGDSASGAVAASGAASASAGEERADSSGFSFHGYQRIRLMAVDTRGSDAAGLYGEPLSPLNSVQYRLEIEASKRIAAHLRAGGLLRISSEGREVLESGPEYLGSEWGSAFAEYDAAGFRARLGYYSLSMTPLTVMRWDWDDNPRVGGDTGCGCGGAAAGALLVESLEELGSDLTFEGALLSYVGRNLETRLFYAIPRRAVETSYTAYRYAAEDRARYSLELCGFETRWQRLDRRTGLHWKAGVHAVASFENERSVDFQNLGYSSFDTWTDTWTVSFTAEAPLIRYVRARGEIIAWNRAEEHGILTVDGTTDATSEGEGGIGGIAIETPGRFALMIDYMRLGADFYTPFSALSYDPNAEGARVSAGAPVYRDLAYLSLFYKRLREVDVAAIGMERKQVWLAGASLDLDLGAGIGASLGWLEKKSRRNGEIMRLDERRSAIVASLQRDFARLGVIRLQYERTDGEESSVSPATESGADTYSLYSSVYF
ncbi:MAG: TlpA disulfide reductase family protein [Candidatus Krumholzibacteria bacterium]|nr:TlpA disulfide reductase family protein [Candidatus Krumholzibacteria bacterium]